MSRPARFTQAELARAIAAADRCGKVAVQTPLGIAFVDSAMIAQTVPGESSEENSCAGKFGRQP